MKLVNYHTTEGRRVALYDGARVMLMGETRTKSIPKNEARYITELRDATRRDIGKFRRNVVRFNGGTLRGLPKTVRSFID